MGRFNTFQNGSIYWSPEAGAHAVFGPIEWFWALTGREAGVYRYPIDEPTYDGDDVLQDFEKGRRQCHHRHGRPEGARSWWDSSTSTAAVCPA